MSERGASASRIVLAAVAVDYLAVGMMRTLLPFYGKQLGGTPFTQGALEALYGAGQVLGSVVLGQWSDGRGRKAGLQVSFGGSAIGYALIAVAISGIAGDLSLALLLASRVPVGLAKQTITISRAGAPAPHLARASSPTRALARGVIIRTRSFHLRPLPSDRQSSPT
jgi:MFS family permease